MRTLKAVIVLAFCLALSFTVSGAFTIPNANDVSYPRQAVAMESDYAALVAGIGGEGVTSGCAVTASSPLSFTLQIAACAVVINGVAVSEGAGSVIIPAPDSLPRVDLVVIETDGDYDVLEGVPAVTPYTVDLPTNVVLLAAVYVPANAQTISGVNIVDKRVTPPSGGDSGPSFPFEIDVTEYGAVCDGTTDDADEIQDAFDAALAVSGRAAEVVFPATRCAVGTALVLGSATAGVDSYLSIRGVSSATSGLRWIGATNATVLKLSRIKYFTVTHFGLTNGVAVGTTVGILEGGNSAGYGGTQTLAGVFTDVSVTGFSIGIRAGDGGVQAAASEILYQDVGFYNNTTGFSEIDLNSLNHTFLNVSCDANGTCLDFLASTGTVLGGSFSNSTVADIAIEQNGAFNITGIRSEGANRVVTSTSGGLVTLESIEVVSPSNADRVVVSGAFGQLTILGSKIGGKVSCSNCPFVTVRDSRILGDTSLPFFIATGASIRYDVSNTQYWDENVGDSSLRPYGDKSGVLATLTVSGTDTTADYPIYTQQMPPLNMGDNTSSLTAWLLKRVRMLSEGTRVDGQNLRVQTTLGAGATTTFTFQRNVTVNIVNETITATSGRFYLSDVGKPVTLAGISLNPVGANVTRVIDRYISSTQVTVAPKSDYMFGGGQNGITATIGANEPDANYMVIGSCPTATAIGFDTLTTSGFVFVANAPGHVCTAMVLR